jgi:hypothetical protein
VPARAIALDVVYGKLVDFVNALLSDFPGGEGVSYYFAERAQHEPSMQQDLMCLLVCKAVGSRPASNTMPLAAVWSLNLAASHFLDEAQDSDRFEKVNNGVIALGAANAALSQLDADEDTLRDILDAVGRVTALGANAQNDELRNGRIWSEAEYFRNVAGKAAAIIATGVWMGGRLATDDAQTLKLLKEFGLALGMANQISDDCFDLATDLAQGTYTLPVIKGLAMKSHPDHEALTRLTSKLSLEEKDIQAIMDLLTNMETIDACKRVVRAYQVQAAAVFKIIPGLEAYFANYVVPKP